MSKVSEQKCFYVEPKYGRCGYEVKSRFQGDCRVASFVEEIEADQYADYRNRMLEKHNTTDTAKYWGD